jgi:hypothetical protein
MQRTGLRMGTRQGQLWYGGGHPGKNGNCLHRMGWINCVRAGHDVPARDSISRKQKALNDATV